MNKLLLAAMLAVLYSSSSSAAVFDAAFGAGLNQAYYGNWGTNADAANPAPNSYKNYRKRRPVEGDGLAIATTDESDPTSATWSGIFQETILQAPGMFIGQSPSTTSYEDNVLYLGGIFDVVNGGPNGDTAGRTDWGVRVGFLEDPDEFIGQRAPNDESWDLWAGDWGSDGVAFQFRTGASDNDDTSRIGSTEQYVRLNVGGILFQAGGPTSPNVADERQRDRFGSGIQTSEPSAVGPGGAIEPVNAWTETGLGYDERLEIRWWMEQPEPDGDVTFFATVGEVVFQQTFDPTGAIPNPTNDPENPFTDGFFDWQNATPVFYAGSVGGTSDGLAEMGFFNPNPLPNCDFDGSGACDLADLDELLYTGISSGDAQYDLDGSGTVDLGDRDEFLLAVGSLPGDADLNGTTNAADLNRLGVSWQSATSSWGDGDFNGDGFDDAGDLNILGLWWQQTGDDFAAAQAPAQAAVPEPRSSLLAGFMLFVAMWRYVEGRIVNPSERLTDDN